jgi:hypothetical protein
MRFSTAILALLVTTLLGCSRGPVVSVTNRSAVVISNAVVSGSLFTNAIGTLQPGEERSVVVHPRGESHVRLTFETGGRKVDSGGLEYFEQSSMYRVSLTVTTNLQIESSSSINHY